MYTVAHWGITLYIPAVAPLWLYIDIYLQWSLCGFIDIYLQWLLWGIILINTCSDYFVASYWYTPAVATFGFILINTCSDTMEYHIDIYLQWPLWVSHWYIPAVTPLWLHWYILAVTPLWLHWYIPAVTPLWLHWYIPAMTPLWLHLYIHAVTPLWLHLYIPAVTPLWLHWYITAVIGYGLCACYGLVMFTWIPLPHMLGSVIPSPPPPSARGNITPTTAMIDTNNLTVIP